MIQGSKTHPPAFVVAQIWFPSAAQLNFDYPVLPNKGSGLGNLLIFQKNFLQLDWLHFLLLWWPLQKKVNELLDLGQVRLRLLSVNLQLFFPPPLSPLAKLYCAFLISISHSLTVKMIPSSYTFQKFHIHWWGRYPRGKQKVQIKPWQAYGPEAGICVPWTS